MHITPWQPPTNTPMIDELRRRLAAARWPDEVVADWRQGTARQPLRTLIDHWQDTYDWQAGAARLAALPHCRAEIDGFGLHFLHYKGRGPSAQPLLLMNGWPSSFVEYTHLAPMLADPAAHGADAALAFDVIIPAHPGFGYSDKPRAPGQVQTEVLFHRLMTEGLGYRSYLAAGTDLGAGVATRMALRYPHAVRGIHLSAVVDPPLVGAAPALTEAERAYSVAVREWNDQQGAYLHLQATRPQTIAYALNDSPVGLASWILEKFRLWSDAGADMFATFPLDMLVDNLNLYWSTQSIGSSMRYYYDSRHLRAPLQVTDRVAVPSAICMWPGDLVVAPREWAQRFYNVQHYIVQPRGGHFPAWEQSELYARDLRAFGTAINRGQ